MNRVLRRVLNTKQENIDFKNNASVSNMIDGQISISQKVGEALSLVVKAGGRIWKSYLSADGNQYVDKNLSVKNLITTKDLKITGATVLGVSATVSTAVHQDAYDVSGKTIIAVDTSSNAVRFGGFANGVKGQIIHIIPVAIGNDWILEHLESSGTQKIYLEEAGDVSNNNYGGISLYCDGSNWFQISRNIQ